MNPNEPLIILLALKGVTSYFLFSNPKASEYEDEYILYIDMTSKAPVWEPSETGFVEQEDSMADFRGEVISNETTTRVRRIINYFSNSEDHGADLTDDKNSHKALNAKVNVDKVGASNERNGVTSEPLYQKWLISPEVARITVQHTT